MSTIVRTLMFFDLDLTFCLALAISLLLRHTSEKLPADSDQ
jgi:hypothetical protein